MKVYVVGPIYPFRGGIAHSNEILCKNLAKNHDVKVISFKRLFPRFLYPGRMQVQEVKDKKVDLEVEYTIDSINPVTWLKTFLSIRQEKLDLLTFQWWTPFFSPSYFTISFLTKLFTRTKVSVICQNVMPHESSALDAFLTKLFFGTSDFFITLSREDLKILKSLLPDAKAEYLAEPTYEDIFSVKTDMREAKKKLNVGENTILFFGFVREYKGLKYLIRAMPIVLKEINAKLLIVGEFWEDKEEYLREIQELGVEESIKIVDRYVSDEEAALYFSAADVLVLPYISSTESGIIQIAYGMNLPVITTNVGGNPDFIEDGKTGIIVPPRDSKALAEAIISYFKEGKRRTYSKEMNTKKDIFLWNEKKEEVFFHGMD